jgi:hypothetical protein
VIGALTGQDSSWLAVINFSCSSGGAVAQLGARLDGIEEVVGSNPIGSTNLFFSFQSDNKNFKGR